MLTANGVDHARQRAALNRAFLARYCMNRSITYKTTSPPFLRDWTRLGLLCDGRDPVNMVEWFEFLAFDLICTLAFSSSFHCLQDQAYHPWFSLLRNFFKSTHFVLTAKALGIFAPLVFVFGPVRHLLEGKEHLKRSYEKVQQRLRMPKDEKRNDFWTCISRQNDQKEGLPRGAAQRRCGMWALRSGRHHHQCPFARGEPQREKLCSIEKIHAGAVADNGRATRVDKRRSSRCLSAIFGGPPQLYRNESGICRDKAHLGLAAVLVQIRADE